MQKRLNIDRRVNLEIIFDLFGSYLQQNGPRGDCTATKQKEILLVLIYVNFSTAGEEKIPFSKTAA